ncbi:MAG: aminodeoxychorismate synthase component I [Gammaproteobacteria bacterium]|nr:MAG: aminodeoxychorismate synthase component I [Gammaproteobacteria bacterium]
MHCCTLKSSHDLQSIAVALPGYYPYLLDSAARGPLGEYSLLLRSGDEQLCKYSDGSITGPGKGNSFLSRLNDWYLQEERSSDNETDWPFTGGWFVYLGYELAAEIEPKVNFPDAGDGFPVAFATRCPAVIYSRPEQPGVLQLAAEDPALLDQLREEIEALVEIVTPTNMEFPGLLPEAPEEFRQAVGKIHEYILDGDVFQVNLSRGWRGEFSRPADAATLYRSLCKSNPAPFAGMVRWREYTLMSSSPERLVRMREREVQSRPIAGTHPRGTDSDSDNALRRELLAHPKERAEHIMLIDLERNDLGRVCETGTVEVDELMVVETYEHVHHIVSNVRGRLRPGVTPVDVIRAVFPGGTITGCPKVRCMEIIAELEKHGRSFYTGSFGYLGLDGSMDLNILIRSMLLHNKHISFRTGAGIVADSDADRELAETQDKARGLLRALGAG